SKTLIGSPLEKWPRRAPAEVENRTVDIKKRGAMPGHLPGVIYHDSDIRQRGIRHAGQRGEVLFTPHNGATGEVGLVAGGGIHPALQPALDVEVTVVGRLRPGGAPSVHPELLKSP